MAISNANANGIPFIKNMRGIPKSIRDAMVLWYDLKKQKATNESMAANLILKDLSGNGNDATCYNFAWSGMSGINGYATEIKANMSNRGGICTIYNGYKLNITHTPLLPSTMMEYEILVGTNVPITYIKVTGLNGITLYGDNQFSDIEDITEDGIYELPAIDNSIGTATIYPCLRTTNENIDCDITIELLPLYPNALISDGVDDYAMVQNKYAVDFTDWLNYLDRTDYTYTNKKITISNIKGTDAFIEKNGIMPSFKIKVSGLTDIGAMLRYGSDFQSSKFFDITEDGEYVLPSYDVPINFIGFRIFYYIGECNITIEQLPINKSLVLNKEDGYTIISKCKRLFNTNNTFNIFIQKGKEDYTRNKGISLWVNHPAGTQYVINFDSINTKNWINDDNDLIQIVSSDFNKGDGEDGDIMYLFKGIIESNSNYNCALYSLLLFNRDLTDDEIDWVKYNLL